MESEFPDMFSQKSALRVEDVDLTPGMDVRSAFQTHALELGGDCLQVHANAARLAG